MIFIINCDLLTKKFVVIKKIIIFAIENYVYNSEMIKVVINLY